MASAERHGKKKILLVEQKTQLTTETGGGFFFFLAGESGGGGQEITKWEVNGSGGLEIALHRQCLGWDRVVVLLLGRGHRWAQAMLIWYNWTCVSVEEKKIITEYGRPPPLPPSLSKGAQEPTWRREFDLNASFHSFLSLSLSTTCVVRLRIVRRRRRRPRSVRRRRRRRSVPLRAARRRRRGRSASTVRAPAASG